MTQFIATPTLLQWSGTEPAISPGYACICSVESDNEKTEQINR